MKQLLMKLRPTVFDNSIDALVPEIWAAEALMVLEHATVAPNLFSRQFENEIARFGDTVHAYKPGRFVGKRKDVNSDVTVQAATATQVDVLLNQHVHVSFLLRDGEESNSMVNLVALYLTPALTAQAQFLDQAMLGEVYNFMGNNVGQLGTSLTKSTIIAAREKLTNNKVPLMNRRFLVTPNSEGDLLNIGDFTKANELGDDGSALREGWLGRKLGFDFVTAGNQPSVATGSTTAASAVNNAGGYAAGSTSVAVDSAAAMTAGEWITIAGDMTPQKITAINTNTLTISPGLVYAVEDDAVVTAYTGGAIDYASDYAAGEVGNLTVDGFTVAPKQGQLMTIGAASTAAKYGVMEGATTTSVLPNQPLAAAAVDDAIVGLGPAGEFNFAFHPEAITLVSRPMPVPNAATGVRAASVVIDNVAVRVVITYDGYKQGHLVTVDMLFGVKTLDTDLGCIVYG